MHVKACQIIGAYSDVPATPVVRRPKLVVSETVNPPGIEMVAFPRDGAGQLPDVRLHQFLLPADLFHGQVVREEIFRRQVLFVIVSIEPEVPDLHI